MSPRRRTLALLLTSLSIIPLWPISASAQTRITAFTVDSETGDFVGRGQTFVLSQVSANGDPFSVHIRGEGDGHIFDAFVAGPLGQPLRTGTYETTDAGDATHARLEIGGDGRGCNTSHGTITIHEVVVAGTVVQAFAATYEYHCESAAPALFGEMRFSSSIGYTAASTPQSVLLEQAQGDPDARVPLDISNTGSDPLDVVQLTVQGAEAGDFAVYADACSSSNVAPGSTCRLIIRYVPDSPNPSSAVLRILDNTNRSSRDVVLSGRPASTDPPASPPPPPDTPVDEPLLPTITRTRLYGEYGRRGAYELFHVGDEVIQAGFLIPKNAGPRLRFTIQVRRGGWKTLATKYFDVKKGVAAVAFLARRGTYRTINVFDGNAKFAASHSKWEFFKITA